MYGKITTSRSGSSGKRSLNSKRSSPRSIDRRRWTRGARAASLFFAGLKCFVTGSGRAHASTPVRGMFGRATGKPSNDSGFLAPLLPLSAVGQERRSAARRCTRAKWCSR